jgi:hypothetical protein
MMKSKCQIILLRVRTFLPNSAYCYAVRTISYRFALLRIRNILTNILIRGIAKQAWRIVSEGSRLSGLPCWLSAPDTFSLLRVVPDTRIFQHIAKFFLRIMSEGLLLNVPYVSLVLSDGKRFSRFAQL